MLLTRKILEYCERRCDEIEREQRERAKANPNDDSLNQSQADPEKVARLNDRFDVDPMWLYTDEARIQSYINSGMELAALDPGRRTMALATIQYQLDQVEDISIRISRSTRDMPRKGAEYLAWEAVRYDVLLLGSRIRHLQLVIKTMPCRRTSPLAQKHGKEYEKGPKKEARKALKRANGDLVGQLGQQLRQDNGVEIADE